MAQPQPLDVADSASPLDTEQQLREREKQYRDIFEATGDGLLILDMSGIIVEANPAYCEMHGYTRDEIVGRHVTEMLAPEYRDVIPRDLRTIQEGGRTHNHTPGIRKDGSLFYAEARGRTFAYKGEPHVLVVVRDITERVQAYELLEQRVAERTRELSTLLEVAHTVTLTLELDPLIDLILEQLERIVEYTDVSLVFVDGEELEVIGNRGPLPREVLLHARFALDPNVPTWPVITGGTAVVIDDVLEDTPQARGFRQSAGPVLDMMGVRSWLAVPLVLDDRVIGALSLMHRQPGYYTEHHAELTTAIAQQTAIAIENAQLFERARQTAVLEERQRLSRELHDSVSQALYSIALGTRTARALLARDANRVAEPLDFVLAQAERGLAEMRALIFELRPEALEQDGLVTAIQRQADLIAARHGIGVELSLGGEPEVSLRVKEALYRITQEALHNTVKHAGARHIGIALSLEGDDLTFCITDDGAGFDVGGDFPGHYGLRSMQERAAGVGGVTRIESAPGKGTTICVAVPASPETASTPPLGQVALPRS